MLFHGGYKEVKNPKIIISEFSKDFGQGFYCTNIREQAERWASRKTTPTVSRYNQLKNVTLNKLIFDGMSDEWLDFIAQCRNAEPGDLLHEYDVIEGPMADDQIYNYVNEYIEGKLSKEEFKILAKWNHPTHQMCFVTQKALDSLVFQKSWESKRKEQNNEDD